MLDSKAAMVRFLNLIAAEPDIARAGDDRFVEVEDRGGLKWCRQVVINSISMKEGKQSSCARRTRQVLRRCGHRDGLRRERPGRHAAAQDRHLRAGLRAAHPRDRLPAEDIVFDPTSSRSPRGSTSTSTTRSTSPSHALDTRHLPYAKVSGGVSNVTSVSRQRPVREAITPCSLPRDRAGMSMGIVTRVSSASTTRSAGLRERVEDVVLNRRLMRPSASWRAGSFKSQGNRSRGLCMAQRASRRGSHAPVRGITTYIIEDTEEARKNFLASGGLRST